MSDLRTSCHRRHERIDLVRELSPSSGPVRVRTGEDADDRDRVPGVVDPVDHAVGAASGAMAIVEGRSQLLTDSVRIGEQWSGDEFEGGGGRPRG